MINIKDQKLFILVYIIFPAFCLSQSNHLYYHKNPSPVESGSTIRISQTLFNEQKIEYGILFFRDVGEISFQEVQMNYEDGNWVGIISGNRVSYNDIEYVTVLYKQDGGRISMPLNDSPFSTPLKLQVLASTKNQKQINSNFSEYADADILILSPEDGAFLRSEEVVICIII